MKEFFYKHISLFILALYTLDLVACIIYNHPLLILYAICVVCAVIYNLFEYNVIKRKDKQKPNNL